MSTWALGLNDVSDETRALRDKLSSKDSQVVAQQEKLLKQAADLEELQERFNEALHKLASEASRSAVLEGDLRRRSEELQNERIVSENARNALNNALEKNKERNREVRDLEATLERISHTSDQHLTQRTKLEKEKTTLEARVRELEQLRLVSPPSPAFTPGRRIPKPRSSSLSNIRINTLEQDLTGLRSQLASKGADIENMSQKLSRALHDRNKAENERIASERKWLSQIEALQSELDEKDEELAFLREQGGDGSREDELLKRIEEDDARISALELMLRDAEDSKEHKEKLRRLEIHLNEECRQRKQVEARCLELSRERDECLNALDKSRQEAASLAKQLEERTQRDVDFEERASRSLHTYEESTTNDFPSQTDTICHLERLLVAVDRLRAERDGLRRDLLFLESESRFTIEALERKLASSSVSMYSDTQPTSKTLGQMKDEMDELHAHLNEVAEEYAIKLNSKNHKICTLNLYLEGLAVAFNRITSLESRSLPPPEAEALKSLEERYEVTVLGLKAMTSQRDDLLVQLQSKDAEWENEARLAQHDIDELKKAVIELNAHIDHIESERDSLALQVTNLTSDLQNAQDELANAQTRYTNLQFHQLSNMTSNEATRTLREHIEELEARVMRRTEQIGIHQHDIRRLETNLRLQEERLSEMTTELEMMAAQKDAMVEDCADAREARDEALARVESLEEELEAASENEELVTDLIAVIVDTSARARKAIQEAKATATNRESAFQTTIARLEAKIGDMQQNHAVSMQNILQQQQELEDGLKDYEQAQEDQEKQVMDLKLQHAEELASWHKRLVAREGAFEDLQIQHKSAEVNHQLALEDATTLIKELEDQLEVTKKCFEDLQNSQSKFHHSEEEYAARVAELEREAQRLSDDYQNVLQARDAIEKEKCELESLLEKMESDHEQHIAEVHSEHLGSQQNMENRLETLQKELDRHVHLLDDMKTEANQLTHSLQEEVDGRTREREEYDMKLQSMNQQSENLKDELRGLQRDLVDVQSKLQEVECQVRDREDEKTVLQQDITGLGAEIQKLKSLNRYLESQSKESEHIVTTLKGEAERLRLELAHSEKACKAAEVNLSLQNAQHKRETLQLQREVSSLRRIPNLETALRELEERNNEMEELLRSKCAEIEANDDRVLEMLKEKKKLLSKVESLNRKVQNLQAKLSVAKATNVQPSSEQQHSSPVASSSNTNSTPPKSRPRAATVAQTPSLPSQLPQTAPPRTSLRNPAQRIASGSSLPRPKTPERNRTPVFKARTPERPDVNLIPENTVIGKKRAAPEDFETVENIPAHAFSADGKDVENRTPRVRRVLGSLQSSFTPNRSSNRLPVRQPSPKRPELPLGATHMFDMTNSPFALPPVAMSSAKSSKRSWLGKIRGASQVGDKTSSGDRNFLGAGESS